MRRFLTVEQVCEDLGISRCTWDKWRAKKTAPPAKKLPNGQLRVAVEDYEYWLQGLEAA